MPFLACILPVVSYICEPVMSAVRVSLETLAQRFFTFLTDWGVDHVRTVVSSRRVDFVEVPVSTTSIVGAEETLNEIRALLKNDSVGIIGIYGMGGIGKTTLLSRINNDVYESRTARGKFDLGIWVTVSKEVSIPAIQKQIARRLKLNVSGNESQDATTLFQALSQRRFLVLLDDLWAKLDLVKVGIPLPTDRPNCKIAFTTRLRQVCTDMDASRCVRVKPLDDGRSWELFRSKVGTEVNLDDSPLQRLAKQVVDRCGGLPLALSTVGRAMANRTHHGEWKLAVKTLDHKAEELGDVKDQVLSQLKFSYDYLKNDKMRSALLYCAMYPEDTEIWKEELIGHWIGEGMLDDDDIVDARSRAHGLITDLQHSCLLEASSRNGERYVRMHDSVRDLALWLNKTDRMEYEEVYGFVAGEDLTEGADTQRRVADTQRRVHIRRIWMQKLDLTASPPRLQNCPLESWTLLLNESRLQPCLLQGIFNCMRTLRVLDLTDAEYLEELPIEIGCLQHLQYLNLSDTSLKSLPKELGKLSKLRQLGLRGTLFLCRIPREAIAGLSSLQVLNMFNCGYEWSAQGDPPAREVSMVDNEENEQHSSSNAGAAEGSGGRQLEVSDVEGLTRLQELGISLKSPHALEKLLRSESPWQCTRYLEVGGNLKELNLMRDGELRISLDQLSCLEFIVLSSFNCETTTTTTIVLEGTSAESFRRLDVISSKGWKKLKLLGKFPSLLRIDVDFSDMEEVLLGEDNDGSGSQQDTRQEQHLDSRFPMLQSISLYKLTDLKSIGRRPLFLPSLESILVRSCPQLRRLPLGRGSAPKLKEICGEQEWWDALAWDASGGDDPNIQNIFAPFFSTGRSIYPENDLSLLL